MPQEKTKEQLIEEVEFLQKEIAECKKNRQLLENIIQAAPLGIGLVRKRILQWTNPEFANMLGYSAEEFKGQNARMLYPSEQEYNRVGIVLYGHMGEEEKETLETRMVCKNGDVLEVMLTAVYLNRNAPEEGAIFTAIDITEKKKTEDQLKISADQWSSTFDALPEVISILDNNNTILRANKTFAQAFGLDAEEIIGKKCYELVHENKMPVTGCPFEMLKKDFKTHTMEINDPNSGIPLLVTVSPVFDKEGKFIGAVHIARDISESRRAKEEINLRIKTLERFHAVSTGRELKMKELKETIRFLEEKLAEEKGQK
ncbi:MAG: PAS domain-containing protein [Candidatus Omnitrophota bacterium]